MMSTHFKSFIRHSRPEKHPRNDSLCALTRSMDKSTVQRVKTICRVQPPKNISKTMVIKFAAMTGTFRYWTAWSNPAICAWRGLPGFAPPALDKSSKPYFARNRLRFKIMTEFTKSKPTYCKGRIHERGYVRSRRHHSTRNLKSHTLKRFHSDNPILELSLRS